VTPPSQAPAASQDGVIVTGHAIERWIERINPRATWAGAEAAIRSHSLAIRRAALVGCTCVKLGEGMRLILDGARVVTVLPKGWVNLPMSVPLADRWKL